MLVRMQKLYKIYMENDTKICLSVVIFIRKLSWTHLHLVSGIIPEPAETDKIEQDKTVSGITPEPAETGGTKPKPNKIKMVSGIKPEPADPNMIYKRHINGLNPMLTDVKKYNTR